MTTRGADVFVTVRGARGPPTRRVSLDKFVAAFALFAGGAEAIGALLLAGLDLNGFHGDAAAPYRVNMHGGRAGNSSVVAKRVHGPAVRVPKGHAKVSSAVGSLSAIVVRIPGRERRSIGSSEGVALTAGRVVAPYPHLEFLIGAIHLEALIESPVVGPAGVLDLEEELKVVLNRVVVPESERQDGVPSSLPVAPLSERRVALRGEVIHCAVSSGEQLDPAPAISVHVAVSLLEAPVDEDIEHPRETSLLA